MPLGRNWRCLPMEILLPEQTTVDDIVFWTAELIGPERENRQTSDGSYSRPTAGGRHRVR
jgi:hypothetical protein